MDWQLAGLRAEPYFRAYVLTAHRSELTVIGHLSDRDWTRVESCVSGDYTFIWIASAWLSGWGRKGLTGLTGERHKLLGVLIVRAIVDVMFPHDPNTLLKPYIFRSATAEMVREYVNGF